MSRTHSCLALSWLSLSLSCASQGLVTNMGLSRIDFAHRKSWTITENNAIGPTTSLTLRTLDTPSPNNTDTIFLAPINGSDAGAGTLAAPKLTWEAAYTAWAAGAPTKTTIHIIRNGGVGDLTLVSTTAVAPSNPLIVQVELGEGATITFNSATAGIVSTAEFKINGMYVVSTKGFGIAINSATEEGRASYCMFSFSPVGNIGESILLSFPGGGLVRNCIFDGTNSENITTPLRALLAGAAAPLTVSNSIFMNYKSSILYGTGLRSALQFGVGFGSDLTIQHCLFSNNSQSVLIRPDIAQTSEIMNSIFYQNISDVILQDDGGFGGTANIHNCIIDTIANGGGIYDAFLLTETDNIENTNPLFFSSTDFRLQDARRTAPGTEDFFFFTSKAVYNPAIGQIPGDGVDDLGPYWVSYALDVDEWESFEFDNDYWNETVTISENLINHQGYHDIRGNFHRSFDGIRRNIGFTMQSLNWPGTVEAYKFRHLLMSEGAKRWYPRGDNGIFFSASGSATDNADGGWDSTVPGIAVPLKEQAYTGFVCDFTEQGYDIFELADTVSLLDAIGPYIYLAPNGDDTDDGASSSTPVRTLERAIFQCSALSRSTIHVIRNGYVGDMEFESDIFDVVSGVLQVEIGEHAVFIGKMPITGGGAISTQGIGILVAELRIVENTSSLLVVEDHRENQSTMASGSYGVRCLYLPVEVADQAMPMQFENWSPSDNPLYPLNETGEAENFEGNIRSLSVWECEEDE